MRTPRIPPELDPAFVWTENYPGPGHIGMAEREQEARAPRKRAPPPTEVGDEDLTD